MNDNTNDINDCVDEIMSLFVEHRHYEPDTLNEFMLKRKNGNELKSDIIGAVDFCYKALKDIVIRYKIAKQDECEFIKYDVKRVCIMLLKPYFTTSYWIKEEQRKLEKISSDYKFEHGIIDNEPTEDLYNAVVVYLENFIHGLSA